MQDDNPLSALTHLRRPNTQRRHPDTAIMLEAGIELITEGLARRIDGREVALIFPWPTRQLVVRRFNDKAGLRMSRAVFEDRWATAADYYADLLAWALHPGQWRRHRHLAARAVPTLLQAPSFATATATIATADLIVLIGAVSFRIKLMLCGRNGLDPSMRQALSDFYAAAVAWWGAVYAQILAAAHRSLRPDVDQRTFAILMTAMEEGLAVRLLADPASLDHSVDRAGHLLALGALALFEGASADPADGRSLRQVADDRMAAGALNLAATDAVPPSPEPAGRIARGTQAVRGGTDRNQPRPAHQIRDFPFKS